MKKNRNLLIALVILLLILLIVFAVLMRTSDQETEQEETEMTETELPEGLEVELYEGEAESIQSVKIENPSGSFEILREDDDLVLTELTDYAQSQTQLTTLVRNLATLTGTVVEEKVDDWSKYGLDDPKTSAQIDGSEEVTVFLGDYNESASVWYLKCDGDETLYTVPTGKGNLMEASPWSYLERTLTAAYDTEADDMAERLLDVKIERPDLEEPLEIKVAEGTPQAYTSAYDMVSPVHMKTSLKTMTEELYSLFGLTADEVIGVYNEEDAQKYGFDEPIMVMTLELDGNTYVFTIGNEASSGVHYMLFSGTDLLYTISETKLTFLKADANSLFFGIALLPEIDTVSEVELTLDDETILFELENTDGELTGVTADGEELDLKLFRTFYSLLLELDIQEINTEAAEGTQRLVVTYRYLDGSEDTIELLELENGRTSAVLINGEMSFNGRVAYVDKVKTELQHLFEGEAIDTNW